MLEQRQHVAPRLPDFGGYLGVLVLVFSLGLGLGTLTASGVRDRQLLRCLTYN